METHNKPLVVDDFYVDLHLVKQSVIAAGFDTWNPNKGAVGSSVYEGMAFWGQHAVLLRSLILATRGMVVPNSMFFRMTTPGMEKAYIHSDRETADHTCILYMSEHEDEYGTAFYRHKPTGLVEMPSFQEMEEMGIFKELKQDMVTRDPDKWEQIDFVQGKYNRAVIFDAPLFHSRVPLDGLGDSPHNARLIWASHFYKINGYGELS